MSANTDFLAAPLMKVLNSKFSSYFNEFAEKVVAKYNLPIEAVIERHVAMPSGNF